LHTPQLDSGIRHQSERSIMHQWFPILALLTALLFFSGCQTSSFYGQAIRGQYQIFAHQKKVPALLEDQQTPADLRAKLELLERLRAFAASNLSLPVDGHYRKYVDVHRRFVVWNVEAAPEFSLESKTWWYPVVGSLDYRGYFSERGAKEYGAGLRKNGYDVFVGGVEAYSTLGWFDDPVLNTFIFNPEADLAELIFHELAHQEVFAHGDTAFDEAFATTVGEEGARRWLRASGDPSALAAYESQLRRNDQFVQLIKETRERLRILYGDERTETGKIKAAPKKDRRDPEQLRSQKAQIYDQLQQDYAKLKAQWSDDSSYDDWFARDLNNAKLNSVATYYDLVPGFEQLLAQHNGDMKSFFAAAKKLAKLPRKERREQLRILASRR
jgi:predicted aminopeptidase